MRPFSAALIRCSREIEGAHEAQNFVLRLVGLPHTPQIIGEISKDSEPKFFEYPLASRRRVCVRGVA